MAANRRSVGVFALVLALSGLILPVTAGAEEVRGAKHFSVVIEPGPTSGQSLGLGEVTVLNRTGRQVLLRFTLKSVQPPMFRDPGFRDVAFNASPATLATVNIDARVVRR